HHAERRVGARSSTEAVGAGAESRAAALRVRESATDEACDGEGRRHLSALRTVRRALPDGGVGHGEVRAGDSVCVGNGCRGGQRMSGVNDFAFKMATVNGTGSASANSLLMRAIFHMGIPVTGKNLFPSNIQGLPTAYEIRVSKDGYTARPHEVDLVVALNPASFAKDVASVRPGGYLLYDSSWPLDPELVREGITILGVPFGKLCVDNFQGDRNRTLLRNIVYAGALASLLNIDIDLVGRMLVQQFAKKPKLLDANNTAIRLGYDYARAHYECPLPFHLERMDATSDSIIIDGNTAAALGAVFAGATVGAWYPITPSTSLMEAFTMFCKRFRTDPDTGLAKYCSIQAEDELSAAGIAIGAGWAGARAFTNTAGPG